MPGTYSFLNVVATLSGPGGIIPIGSSAGVDDEGITVAMIEEKDNMKFGADGTPMHTLNAAQGSKIHVRLLKTSPVNALLGALYNFQEGSSDNWGQNTLVVSYINANGGDVVTAQSVAFAKFSDLTYSKDPKMNEWVFNAGYTLQDLGLY